VSAADRNPTPVPPREVTATPGWPPIAIPGRPGWWRHLVGGQQVDMATNERQEQQ